LTVHLVLVPLINYCVRRRLIYAKHQ